MANSLRRTLLEKEMSRKEFLQIVGSFLVVLSGLPNFLQLLHNNAKPAATNQANSDVRSGFGTRKFGM